MLRQLTKQAVNLFSQSWRPATRTEVFQKLSNKEMATPELVKAIIKAPIPFHSRASQVSLYHKKRVRHAVTSSFSQHKNKKFKRLHKIKHKFFSEILNQNIRITCSIKAYRIIKKYESFDNYILLTKPKDLDSKFGQYLRSLMLRKINDPQYRIPYILGSNPRPIIKKYKRFILSRNQAKYTIPKQFKKNFQTMQRKFGSIVEQLTEQDYSKYIELQRLKKTVGSQIDPHHPLVLELDSKLKNRFTPEEQARMDQMSQTFKNQYLNNPKNNQKRRAKFQKNQKQAEALQFKLRQAFIKYESQGGKSSD